MKRITRISQTVITGLLSVAVLAGLNVLAAKNPVRWDLTENKRHSLTNEAKVALANVQSPVTAAAFYRPEEPGREQAKDLLELFARHSEQFSYEFVDPDRSPFRAKEYNVAQTGTVVLLSGERKESVVFPDEEKLVNAVIRVSDERSRKVYLITGHGEAAPDAPGERAVRQLQQELSDQGAQVETLALARLERVPEDADLVCLLGPRTDLLPHELEALSTYMHAGGRMVIAVDAESKTSLDNWLEIELGVRRLDGYVLDPVSRLFTGDAMSPIIQEYARHPITKDFNLLTVFPTATAMEAAETAEGVAWLGRSAEQAWLETDLEALRAGQAEFVENEDAPGPLWLAATYAQAGSGDDNGTEARAVIFADQDFFTDQYLNMSGNLDLARNTANWLLEREGLITVNRPKPAAVFLTLSPSGRAVLTWVPLALLPAVLLAAAIFVAGRRRRTP